MADLRLPQIGIYRKTESNLTAEVLGFTYVLPQNTFYAVYSYGSAEIQGPGLANAERHSLWLRALVLQDQILRIPEFEYVRRFSGPRNGMAAIVEDTLINFYGFGRYNNSTIDPRLQIILKDPEEAFFRAVPFEPSLRSLGLR